MEYKTLKRLGSLDGENPQHQCPVIGFDEEAKIERVVCYRIDTNKFFDHPYTGAVYPFERMNKWREVINKFDLHFVSDGQFNNE